MKAYINENNVVIAIGVNDQLFPDCTPIEITEEQKIQIDSFGLPKYINDIFVDDFVEVIVVPEEISKMALSLELFDRGITDQDIFDDIDSVPNSIFPLVEKERAKIKYITARSFVRSNMEVNLVATMEGLSQNEVDQIFINGKSR